MSGLLKLTEPGDKVTNAQFLILFGTIYLSHETSPRIRQLIGLASLLCAAYLGLTQ